ncbi:hypothetical protein D9V37_01125 [Nocardioides mangrovicus]|uniref:Uncharacterized protein n=1 Tax=Nocardioides mangrovicus TaxID=2478913 RepID=A0A3L8P5X2_9ACTN|nr:hypothetical protein D9V37_01125 [Nocardioides mangrovicus]
MMPSTSQESPERFIEIVSRFSASVGEASPLVVVWLTKAMTRTRSASALTTPTFCTVAFTTALVCTAGPVVPSASISLAKVASYSLRYVGVR